MASKKSQQELEQPVKGYQLDAVQAKVDAIDKQVTEGFKTVNGSLEALLIKSNSQVTPQQLADNITAINKTLDEKIKEAEEKIHLTYGPTKRNIGWIVKGITGQGIVIIGAIILAAILRGS